MNTEQRRRYSRLAFYVCLAMVMAVALVPPRVHMPPTGWDKVSHAFAFAVLAMLGRWSYPDRKIHVLWGLLAYGALMELLQGLTAYRTAEFLDLVADGVGIVLGWHLIRLPSKARQ